MLAGNDFAHHVVTRLRDFFTFDSRWHRQLWNVGLVMTLEELDQAIEGRRDGALSADAVGFLAESIKGRVASDPGIGSVQQRATLVKALQGDLTAEGVPHRVIRQVTEDVRTNYLARWEAVLGGGGEKPSRERTARAIGAHLLDAGFSAARLNQWLTGLQDAPVEFSLADLVRMGNELVAEPTGTFEVLILFPRTPPGSSPRPEGWLRRREARTWLNANGFGEQAFPGGAHGALRLRITSRDSFSAVLDAADVADRLAARVAVGTRTSFAPLPVAFVAGDAKPRQLRRSRRVDVHSIDRHRKLYSLAQPTAIDAALELAAPLDIAPGPAAVAGGWSAVEFLLRSPGDRRNVNAADRLAALVACSWPRAELTTIARSRMDSIDDALSADLRNLATNRERCDRLLQAMDADPDLEVPSASDKAALHRMRKLQTNTSEQLNDVQRHAQESLRRLYRQRNLVLHGGRIRSAPLEAALRTAAPLVGAGIDRLAHAELTSGREPLETAARATFELGRAGGAGAPPITALLE